MGKFGVSLLLCTPAIAPRVATQHPSGCCATGGPTLHVRMAQANMFRSALIRRVRPG